MPVPEKVNIETYRGDTLTVTINVWSDDAGTVPADLSTATVRAQVRQTEDDGTVLAAFDPFVDVAGVITLTLPPKEARALPARGVWDCEIDWYSDDTFVQTVVAGVIVAGLDVTRTEGSA